MRKDSRASFKVRNGSYKWLHLQVCQHLLPGEIYRQVAREFFTYPLKKKETRIRHKCCG